jgi:hypothetical protein
MSGKKIIPESLEQIGKTPKYCHFGKRIYPEFSTIFGPITVFLSNILVSKIG